MSETDFERGFVAGWKAALSHQMQAHIPSMWWPTTTTSQLACPVCHMSTDKPMGYVCPNSGCPSRIT